ncbi:hypothetical protein CD006_24820 [Enterobacter sp. 10-1]|nr:hypothetical protein [Raoultella sp. 10-1]PAC08226.1 hypothetical protein CD006_24820 [Enterobacter sp. 10-1]
MAVQKSEGHVKPHPYIDKERRGFNKTTVAVANKNARIIWSMLKNETEYQAVGSYYPARKVAAY